MTEKEMALTAIKALDSKKARSIKLLRVTDVSSVADYFVIATGYTRTQVHALADEVEFQLKNDGELPDHIEGSDAGNWLLMDYGCMLVHIFQPDTRNFYDLERLWEDAEPIDISAWIDDSEIQ